MPVITTLFDIRLSLDYFGFRIGDSGLTPPIRNKTFLNPKSAFTHPKWLRIFLYILDGLPHGDDLLGLLIGN
ncbi:MAG: hypothetical protein KAR36_05695, partial [Candidatus Latescibacteria bacterium]|nr:hypothetical protein [Candidatus Latescibacterota bacterium]